MSAPAGLCGYFISLCLIAEPEHSCHVSGSCGSGYFISLCLIAERYSLCRPLSGAVTCDAWQWINKDITLQLCRSLSGAVTYLSRADPRARGDHVNVGHFLALEGQIPARTGQPLMHRGTSGCNWADPRAHGATRRKTPFQPVAKGRSPRTRGNRQLQPCIEGRFRQIPAHTRQPGGQRGLMIARRADPAHTGQPPWNTGSSSPGWADPRARGNRRRWPYADP